jgi:hypothetical protein
MVAKREMDDVSGPERKGPQNLKMQRRNSKFVIREIWLVISHLLVLALSRAMVAGYVVSHWTHMSNAIPIDRAASLYLFIT